MDNFDITVCGRDNLRNKMYNFSSSFIPSEKQLQEMLSKRDSTSTTTFSPVMYVKSSNLNYFTIDRLEEHIFLRLDLDIFPFEIRGSVYVPTLISFLRGILSDISQKDTNIFSLQSSLRLLYEIPESSNQYISNCQRCRLRYGDYKCKEFNCFSCIENIQKYLLECYDNGVFDKYL